MSKTLIAIQENALTQYNFPDEKFAELKEKYSELNADNPEGYQLVSSGIRDVRSIRTFVEKKRKELKAGALDWGNRVDAEANRIKALLMEIESPLKEKKQFVDVEKARHKAEKLAAEQQRVDDIKDRIQAIGEPTQFTHKFRSGDISAVIEDVKEIEINPDDFAEFTGVAAVKKSEVLKILEDHLAIALDKENEKAKLVEERYRQEEEAKKQAEERKALQAERDEIESERRAIVEEKKAQEQAQKQAEAEIEAKRLAGLEKERIEREAKERAEREAQEKIDQEKREKELAEKKVKGEAARAPDLEKINAFGKEIMDLLDEAPNIKSKKLKAQMDDAINDIGPIASDLYHMA